MSTFKYIASIIGFTLLVLVAMVGLSIVSHGTALPWFLLLALLPAAGLLGLIVTVLIDKPLNRR